MKPDHVRLLKTECFQQMVPAELAMAIVIKESTVNGVPYERAERFEKEFYEERLLTRGKLTMSGYVPKKDPPSFETERAARARSYGYFQLLGETARVIGFKEDWLTELFVPEKNIYWGVKFLKRCIDKSPPITADKASLKPICDRWNGGGDPTYHPELVSILRSAEPSRLLQLA